MHILTSFDLLESISNDAESAKKAKKKSYERFLELGLPQRGSDSYQYERLSPLYETEFSRALDAKKEMQVAPTLTQYAVLVNGQFRPELSSLDKEIVFLSLSQAYVRYSALFANNQARLLQENNNPFSLLNAAMHHEGLFVYVPPKKELHFEIISIVDEQACWIMPRISIFAGASSSVKIVHSKRMHGARDCFYNSVIEATLEDNARLLFDQADFDQASTGWFFEHFDLVLKRSSYASATFADMSSWMRRDLAAKLIGEGAEVDFSGVWLLKEQKEMHTNVRIEHVAPHCRSLQLFKGILDDKAKSSFQGKIYVQKEAQKTEAYQRNNNLLLSPDAVGYAKPNLEIFADDVKASHGATVGQLDANELFYLKSRGIAEKQARNCLIWGFCKEVVAKLSSSTLQGEVENEIKKIA
jgi:Fe-S cluster assembly protein SufD